MSAELIAAIAAQEGRLVFEGFDADRALEVGLDIRGGWRRSARRRWSTSASGTGGSSGSRCRGRRWTTRTGCGGRWRRSGGSTRAPTGWGGSGRRPGGCCRRKRARGGRGVRAGGGRVSA